MFTNLFTQVKQADHQQTNSSEQEELNGHNLGKVKDKKNLFGLQEAPQTQIKKDPKDLLEIASLNDKLVAAYCKVEMWTEAVDACKKSIDIKSEIVKMVSKPENDVDGYDKNMLDSLIETHKKLVAILQAQNGNTSIIDLCHQVNLEKDASMASVYVKMGLRSTKKGEFKLALTYFEAVLDIYKKLDKIEDVDMADVYEGMASVYRYQEKFELCLEVLNKTLEIRVKALGSEDLSVARVYDIYTRFYVDILENKKAQEYCDMSLKIKLSKGCNSIDLAECYLGFGLIFSKESKFDEALKYLNMGIDIYKKEQLQGHPKMVEFYHTLALIQYKQTRYNEALQSNLMAENIAMNKLGLSHYLQADLYENRGLVFTAQRQYQNSQTYYEKCLEIRKNVFGDEHHSIAQLYNHLGGLYFHINLKAKALDYFKLSLDIKAKKFGEQHISLSIVYNNIAVVHNSLGDIANSVDYLIKSLDIREKNYGKDHIETARSKYNIGIAYRRMTDYRLAIVFETEALTTYIKVWGMHHPDVLKTMHQLALNFESVGNIKEAERLLKVSVLVNERNSTKNFPEALKSIEFLKNTSMRCDRHNVDVMSI